MIGNNRPTAIGEIDSVIQKELWDFLDVTHTSILLWPIILFFVSVAKGHMIDSQSSWNAVLDYTALEYS